MDSCSCSNPLLETDSGPDFSFAIDNVRFSDRVLRIEIVSDLPDFKTDVEGCSSIADWPRNRKRWREEFEKGDENSQNQDSPLTTMDSSTVVKTLHISSPILAAKSPFFHKLFTITNEKKDAEQQYVPLRIHASEAAAVMSVLNFIYSNKLSATTPTGIFDILMAADKFEVASCIRYCSKLLRELPMTSESAVLYLELPLSAKMAKALQPLTDAAEQYLVACYRNLTKSRKEFLDLPLTGVEAVLSSDDLQVSSEDVVYYFALKWARKHHPDLEERRRILGSRLVQLIRFPYMSPRKLKKVLTCNDFDPGLASKFVLEALFFKAEPPYRQRSLVTKESCFSYRRFIRRAYKYRTLKVKIVEFEFPRLQCIVYLDLKRDDCANIFPSGRVNSQAFHLGEAKFSLLARCSVSHRGFDPRFDLYLVRQQKGSMSLTVDYELASLTNWSNDYLIKYKATRTFNCGEAVGYTDYFGMRWTSLVGEHSPYFVNGILRFRAVLTLRRRD